MTSVMATRILCVMKALHRPQQFLSRCLNHSLGLSTPHDSTDGLGRISSTISQHMKDKKSQNKLLVVHNPVDELLIQKLKSQGVEKLWCIVGSDENHLKFLKERLKSTDPSHDYSDNVSLCRFVVTDFAEKEILDKVGPVEGVVFLSSMIAGTNPGFYRYMLNKRLVTSSTELFYGLNNVEWFCLIPTNYIQSLYRKIPSVRYFWTFHDLNILYNIKCDEAMSLFQPLDVKSQNITSRGRKYDYKLNLAKHSRQSLEFSLVHIVLKFQQTTLEERKMFYNYLKQQLKNDRLISQAEQWVPGSGKDLIYDGYSYADEIKSLSSERLYNAFKIITSHPEYEGSALQTLLDS